MWGGWGSNPRPADYEKPGPALQVRCVHRYHGVVPPMTLIAPFARVARSTNWSTLNLPITRRQLQNVIAARPTSGCRARWSQKWHRQVTITALVLAWLGFSA
jgi:hypothetical protein